MNNDEIFSENNYLSQSSIPIQLPANSLSSNENLASNNANNSSCNFSTNLNSNHVQMNSTNPIDDLNSIDFSNLIDTNSVDFSLLENKNTKSHPSSNIDLNSSSKKNKISNKKRKKDTNTESPTKESNKKKKKYDPNAQFKRRNIKKIFTDDKLNESTLKALEEEKRRQERLINSNFSTSNLEPLNLIPNIKSNEQHIPNQIDSIIKQDTSELNDSKNSSTNKSSDQSIYIIDDEKQDNKQNNITKIDDDIEDDDIIIEENIQTNSSNLNSKLASNSIEINVSDEENDDDDCRLISESERQQDDEAKNKKRLRGIHMNDEYNVPDANGQVLVNVNHPPEDIDIYLLPYISKNVKSHQIGGIRFIYDNIVESLERVKIKDSGFGCILAHAMGLGKTLQTISFVEVFLRCTGCKRVLCIVPINTIQNWLSEFNYWLPENGQHQLDNDTFINYNRPFKVYVINDFIKTYKQRIDIITNWKTTGGVLLIGYEMFRTLVTNTAENFGKQTKSSKNKNKNKNSESNANELIDVDEEENKMMKFQDAKEALLTPCLVVCDEGHRIKNNAAHIAKTLQRIKTKRRVVLTGYPLQNNLIEYWCMVDFVRPNYLGTKAEFSNMFERPIMNGQCIDSTREDVKLMRFRAHVLHSLLEGFVQRRGHDVFFSSLPKKQEYVVLLKLSPIQKELYLAFMEAIGAMNQGEKSNPLRSFAICCKIWNHPDVLYKYNQLRENEIDLDLPELQQQQQQQQAQNKSKSINNSSSNKSVYISMPTSSSHVILEDSGFNPFASICNEMQNSLTKSSFNPDWANKLLESYKAEILENGAKFHFSFTLIEQSILSGDRILLFSQSLLSLNLIEEYLQKMKLPNSDQKWQKYKNYYRLDGSTTGVERERLINSFNQPNSPIWLFLLSTRAGCLGINLIGANRVIVLDASWNPCHDSQAVCRVYRYGQTKNCFIYRLIADHTMEKKIYDRQISKQTMSDRVVDEIQTQSHFTRTEVEKLIHFVKEDVPCADLTDIDKKYNDKVLIESCLKHSNVITKEPFTHESLLIDKKEYQLSEREKAMAFRNYNHDKKYFPLIRSSSTSLLYQQIHYGSGIGNGSNNNFPFANPPPLPPSYYNQPRFSSTIINNKSNLHNSASSFNINENSHLASNQKLDFCLNKNLPEFSNQLNNYSISNITNFNNNNNNKNNNSNNKNYEEIKSPITHINDDNSLNTNHFNNNNNNNHQQEISSSCSPGINLASNPFQNLRDVKISSFIAPSKLVIPTSSSGTTSQQADEQFNSIVIQPGEKVFIFKTQKGCYLRTQDKKFIALRNKTAEDCVASLTFHSQPEIQQQQQLNQKVSIDMSNFASNSSNEQISNNQTHNSNLINCNINNESMNQFNQQMFSNSNLQYNYANSNGDQQNYTNQSVNAQNNNNFVGTFNNNGDNNVDYNFNINNTNGTNNNNSTFLY